MDIEKLRNMRLIPFESPFYFVHLHGLEVTDELAQEIRKNTTNLPHGKKLYGFDLGGITEVSGFDLGGFTGFLSQHSRFHNWVQDLSNRKHRRLIERFKGKTTFDIAKALNFIDQHTTMQSRKMYSLQIIDPVFLRAFSGVDLPHPDTPEIKNNLLLTEINITMGLLRIRGFKFLTPFISSIPYRNFFNYNEMNQFNMVGLDDSEVRKTFFGPRKLLSLEDVKWIREHFGWLYNGYINGEIRGMKAFEDAFAMILNNIYANDDQVRYSIAWSGLESLLKPPSINIGRNMKHRMCFDNLISEEKAQILWKYRNKVMHGDLSEKQKKNLPKLSEQLHDLLCSYTAFFIEQKIVPTKKNLDKRFGKFLEIRCRDCNEILKCHNCEKANDDDKI